MFLAMTGSSLPPAAVPHSVIVAGLGAQQIGVIVLTILFAGFFASNRAETLALRAPRGGWGMLVLLLVPLFAITGAWSAFMWWWRPEVVLGDLRIFSDLLHGESGSSPCSSSLSARPLRRSSCFAASCSPGSRSRGSG